MHMLQALAFVEAISYVSWLEKTNHSLAKSFSVFDGYCNYFTVSTLLANLELITRKMAEIWLFLSQVTSEVMIAEQ